MSNKSARKAELEDLLNRIHYLLNQSYVDMYVVREITDDIEEHVPALKNAVRRETAPVIQPKLTDKLNGWNISALVIAVFSLGTAFASIEAAVVGLAVSGICRSIAMIWERFR